MNHKKVPLPTWGALVGVVGVVLGPALRGVYDAEGQRWTAARCAAIIRGNTSCYHRLSQQPVLHTTVQF